MNNYQYFSGANTYIEFNNNKLIECAGISYSLQNSQQPIYGYGSTVFDAVLPGREIIQGNFVINYTEPNYIVNLLGGTVATFNTFLLPKFDIKIMFGNDNKKSRIIQSCFLVSMGQSIQISEQVILEEYSFIGRNLINGVNQYGI
jgi:hypothetical protein